MPRRGPLQFGVLLLPQPPAQQSRTLSQQGPLPVRADPAPALPPASRRRGPRVSPASHFLRHQCARHRLHYTEGGQLALLRSPTRRRQRPRTAYRPPPHPDRPRRLQGAVGLHPRRQPGHRPARPNLRDRRPRRTRRNSHHGCPRVDSFIVDPGLRACRDSRTSRNAST